MISALRKNISAALGMVGELSSFITQPESDDLTQRKMMEDITASLVRRLKVLNNSIPVLVKQITLAKSLEGDKRRAAAERAAEQTAAQSAEIEDVDFGGEENAQQQVSLPRGMRSAFINELEISEQLIKRLKKKKQWLHKKEPAFKKPNVYARLSNRFFLPFSQRMVNQGYFKSLGLEIRRSNMNILTVSYLSMMFMTAFLSIFAGLLLMFFFLFFSFSINPPFLVAYSGSYLARLVQVIWFVVGVPAATFLFMYVYPSTEQSSAAKRIEQELPFVVVHMGSIAGSGIEPLEIFKIIALSKDYKFAGKEIKKILNQTNVYGYDLTTALRNVARSTPSQKLSELLNGMSITINSGGDMKVFFEKRAESLLLEYRIEREKFTKNAETVMDIYISVVISTPMILLLLLIMISVSGISLGGFSVDQLSYGVILLVAVINVFFLIFLQMKQPSY